VLIVFKWFDIHKILICGKFISIGKVAWGVLFEYRTLTMLPPWPASRMEPKSGGALELIIITSNLREYLSLINQLPMFICRTMSGSCCG
jgi:hypothetical protein